jgi:hypothetical protein
VVWKSRWGCWKRHGPLRIEVLRIDHKHLAGVYRYETEVAPPATAKLRIGVVSQVREFERAGFCIRARTDHEPGFNYPVFVTCMTLKEGRI